MKIALAALFAGALAAFLPALADAPAAPATPFLAPAASGEWVGGYEQDVTGGVAHGAHRIQNGVAYLDGGVSGGVELI